MILLFFLLAIGLISAMTLAWWVALRTGKSGWIDAIWAYAVGAACVVAAFAPVDGLVGPRSLVAGGLVAIWSLRLGSHITLRNVSGKGEDPRYTQLQKEWGSKAKPQLWLFLQIQAAAALVLAMSVAAAARMPGLIGINDYLGILVAVVAIVGEGVADRQLSAFRKDPANKGKVADKGLWGLSRHPNYFFEWLFWVAFPVIGLWHAWGWLTLLAPAMMYALLAHISGVPPLEAHMLRSRPDAFRNYQSRVSAFWPILKRGGA